MRGRIFTWPLLTAALCLSGGACKPSEKAKSTSPGVGSPIKPVEPIAGLPPKAPPLQVAAGELVPGEVGSTLLASTPPPVVQPKPPRPPLPPELAPPASPRLDNALPTEQLKSKVESALAGHIGRRFYLQTDKPLYKPGETVWLKVYDLTTRAFAGTHSGAQAGLFVELVSPRGASVLKKKVREAAGMAQVDLPLAFAIAGGEYTLRIKTLDGQKAERPIVVSSYEAPKLKMKMEFVRKAYGPGDEVSATFEVRRPTGEALAKQTLTAAIRLDGQDLPRVAFTTDAQGDAIVRFPLPPTISVGDALLTVLVEDGGLTESISRRVPIVLSKLRFATFPEGGELVMGVPGRVYFEAKNPLGKPADVSGRVVDDMGVIVHSFRSVRDGMGRFDLTPQVGRTYHVEIDSPVGIADQFAVPRAKLDGCVLRSYDDWDGQLAATRVGIRCTGTTPRKVVVGGVLRENLLDVGTVEVPPGGESVVYLEPKGQGSQTVGRAQGVARVTLYDEKLAPLAERLIFRQRRARLAVKVTPDRKSYVPRDKVELEIETTDAQGQPTPADLSLSVIDDTVLSFADDKTGHILSRLYLEPELPSKVEEPNYYFDLSEEHSAQALDLLLGTKGYRQFVVPNTLLVAQNDHPKLSIRRTVAQRPHLAPAKANRAKDDLALDDGLVVGLAEKASKKKEVAAPRPDKAPHALYKPQAGPQAGPQAEPPAERAVDAVFADNKAVARDKASVRTEASKAPSVQREAEAMAMPTPIVAPATKTPAPPPVAAATTAAAPEPARVEEKRAAGAFRPPPVMPAAPLAKAKAEADAIANEEQGMDGLRKGKVALAAPQGAGQAAALPRDANLGIDQGGLAARGRIAVLQPIRKPVARPAEPWAPVRVFPVPDYTPGYSGPRNDFRETVFWQPSVQTGQDGKARLQFTLSDAVTSFRVLTEGVGSGAAGRQETVVKSSLPFSLAAKLPLEVSEGDRVLLPVSLSNEQGMQLQVNLNAQFGTLLSLEQRVEKTTGTLAPMGRDTLYFPLLVTGKKGLSEVRLRADASGLQDELLRSVRVTPRGFPQHLARAGQLKPTWNGDIELSEAMVGTVEGQLRVYPSMLSNMVASLEGMLRHPVGCFEQASSVNYPNVMILRFLKNEGISDAKLLGRASRLVDEGYKRLVGYETSTQGYEWFGASPGHEALTAFGLLQFADMKPVYSDVDKAMLSRTMDWLLARRDGKGGFLREAKSLDSFGRAAKDVTDAYIAYALSEAKYAGLGAELDVAAHVASNSNDAYLLSLTSLTLLNSGRRGPGQTGAHRLAALQSDTGAWTKADHSITRSGGMNLHIETTSLAILALLRAGGFDAQVDHGVEWLLANRGGFGAWGSTQATVLAIKALTAYTKSQAQKHSGGQISLLLNGQVIDTKSYDFGDRDPLVFSRLGDRLAGGKNHIELRSTGQLPIAFSLGVDYRSLQPATSKSAPIALTTVLERDRVKLGESVRLRVTLTNQHDRGQPMTLARVELPGGLAFQTWQLKELRDKGLIAFYETQPRQVILYLRDMQPKESREIPLDLVAAIPGQYTAQASTAYLYYTDEHKSWVPGTQVSIEP